MTKNSDHEDCSQTKILGMNNLPTKNLGANNFSTQNLNR